MPESIPAAGGASFLFASCQVGAEAALKAEAAAAGQGLHFAYSRPGFVTFKAPGLARWPQRPVFARASGRSLARISAASAHELAQAASAALGDRQFDRLHVWQRDAARPGHHGFEPGRTAAVAEAEAALMGLPHFARLPLGPAEIGERVLDCIIVEPSLWWLGEHVAERVEDCWPGGIPELHPPADMISRAWLKMSEAIAWSGFELAAGQTCAEIGCAPGGASQALLGRKLNVIGIDPAEIDARIAKHPNFVHLRKRGADVRRREFRHVRLLATDINVAPQYTLDTVEAIVTHSEVNIKYLLLTLKLLEWKLAAEIPAYIERVRGWGYRRVRVRQLSHNRQEICLAAARRTATPAGRHRSTPE